MSSFISVSDRIVSAWSKPIVVQISKAAETIPRNEGQAKASHRRSDSAATTDSAEDVLTGQKLSESVRRAWYKDTEKEGNASFSAEKEVEEEFYPRSVPSFRLGRTMFGKARDPSPEPEEIDSDSGDDGTYVTKKVTPTSSATKPKKKEDNLDELFTNPNSWIEEEGEEDILDETEASYDGRYEKINSSFAEPGMPVACC